MKQVQARYWFLGWAFAKTLLLGVLVATLAPALGAQPLTTSRIDDLLRVADEELADDRPYSALTLLEEVYEREPSTALAYRIGMLNWELRDYRKAVSYLQRSLRKAADGERPEAYFYLGRAQKMEGFYGEAMESFREFKRQAPQDARVALADLEIAGAQMALKMTDPPRIKVDNAGRLVNTSNQEYSPVLAADGQLYYAGFGTSQLVAEDGAEAAAIQVYTSKPGASGDFGKGVVIPKHINREGYSTVNVALSPDGNTMAFVRTQLEGRTLVESKIYASAKTGDGWGPANELRGVNGAHLAKNPAFGELYSKEVLLFASDMPGGKGGFDLYYATRNPDGSYTTPTNLGEVINTPFDEVTPFFRDGTLYFSTEGRPTLGGFDVFRSDWSGDAWSEPVNMGKGFNSSYDDRYFQLDGTGKKGVLTSNRPPTRSVKSKTCCDDIFLLNVEPIVIDLLATTLDDEGNLLTEVTVDLLEVTDGDTTVLARKVNPKGNRFDFALVDDKNYVIIGRREGYTQDATEFNTLGITEPTSLQRSLVLVRESGNTGDGDGETIELTLNQPIRLANIYYDYDDDKILAAAEPDLEYIRNIMSEYPEMKVELGSHTDARGRDAYNLELSQRRAQSAVDWLVGKGIDRGRLRARGYGETQLLNRCLNNVTCSDEEHRFNRRTEFKITEGPTTITVKKQTRTEVTPPQTRPSPRTPAPRGNRSGKQSVPTPPRSAKPGVATGSTADGIRGSAGGEARPPRDTLPAGRADRGSASATLEPSAAQDSPGTTELRARVTEMSSLFYEPSIEGLPILVFDDRQIEFGDVKRGDTREHRYEFTNVGTVPASIAIVSACECTTLDWTRGEIAPGASGFVHARFDSKDKPAGELITIDVILDQVAPSGNGIIERLEYTFEIE